MAVTIDRDGPISILRLDRPEKLNAFDRAQYAALNQSIAEFEADAEARVGIITSTHDRAFSVGVDLDDLSRAVSEEHLDNESLAAAFGLSIGRRGAVTKPLIAAVSGHCVGEGFGLALYCDMRVAASNAVFSLPEAKVGITTLRATIRLPQVIGLGNALELLLAGVKKDAQWALRVGLVNAVVPPEELMDTALALARQIAEASPRAVRNIRHLALESFSLPFDEAVEMGLEMRRQTPRAETAQGTKAFLEKKKPDF
jgi:enoyl-CoA hydratase/carnithine racemase